MKFSGVTILQGVEFSILPIDFEWALQQCSATALPVIFLFYDQPFLHVCKLEENLLFSTLIFGSVFSDYVIFYEDIS